MRALEVSSFVEILKYLIHFAIQVLIGRSTLVHLLNIGLFPAIAILNLFQSL